MARIGASRPAALLLRVLVAQVAGAVAAVSLAFGLAVPFGVTIDLFVVLAGGGIVAAWLGERFLRLPRWWIPVQMVMPPAAALLSSLQLPAWIYLAAFVLLLGLYWNAARGVPLYLTNRTTHKELISLLPERAGLRFIDLGHGFGGTVLALARARPDACVEGVESAPLPFAASWMRSLVGAPANARLAYRNFWKHGLQTYDVVYAFLSPVPMQALYAKARAEMTEGSLLISNSFPVPARPAHEVRVLADRRGTRLFVYRM